MLARFVLEILLPLALLAAVIGLVARQRDLAVGQFLAADRGRLVAAVLGTALVLGALAATYAFGDPPGLAGRYDFDLYHLAALLFAVGVWTSTYAGRHYGLATRIRDAEATTGTSDGTDAVRVDGTVETVAETVTGPYSGLECVAVEAGELVADPSKVGVWDPNRAQQVVDAERFHAPFRVVTETGSTLVDPADVHCSFLRDERVGDGTRVERRLAPGDPVTVVGRVTGGTVAGDPVVLASPHNESLDRFARNVPRLVVLGPALALVGVLGMALTAGAV